MALVFFILPLGIYLSLCLLPSDRAPLGIAIAAGAVALVWFMNDPAQDDGFGRIIATMAGAGVVMAGVAQGLRLVIARGRPGWVWPAIIGFVALSALAIFLSLLGA